MQTVPVKRLTCEPKLRFLGAIDLVSRDRVVDRGHMYADLVRSSGLQCNMQQRMCTKPLQHIPVRHRFSAVANDSHTLSVLRMAADGCIDRAVFLTKVAINECKILSSGLVRLELLGKRPVHSVILCDNEQSRSHAVNAMYNAGPLHTADR